MVETASRAKSLTLQHVADLAGVSLGTASKALSGATDVAPTTREKVRAVAAELGYAPRSKRTAAAPWNRAMTMAFDTFGSLYANELLSGALAEANDAGYVFDLSLLPPGIEGYEVAHQWISGRIQAGCRGALLVTSIISPEVERVAEELQFSLVAIDPKHRTDHGVVSIGATNWVGGVSATEHLLGLGHTRIGFAGFDPAAQYSAERYSGFRWAVENAGSEVNPRWVYDGATDYAFGRWVGDQIIASSNRPTAVVCVADPVAFGVIEGFRQQGLAVPEDLSVVGFDDVQAARWTSPALTTVRQPLASMGRLGVRTLLEIIQGKEPESNRMQLATDLIVRQSTAPPK